MIYLDNGATSFQKPECVYKAVEGAMRSCASPGRGGYAGARNAERVVYGCREIAADLFHCDPLQVVLTNNCTHGLNIAIHSVVKPGMKVAISGFEHNAVVRPLYAIGAEILTFGRKLFDWKDTIKSFEKAMENGAEAVVFTHVSNVFGYILPIEELAEKCRKRNIPFIIDAAQSAGSLFLDFQKLGADFIAMPGHKGLLGPQGTGILLCKDGGEPLLFGGTGVLSRGRTMPNELPERLESGTLNVPGIAGLAAGMAWVQKTGQGSILRREHEQCMACARGLQELGMEVFAGDHQAGTVSFVPGMDCTEAAQELAGQGIALRAGLHCAPLAHESAGTLETGTLRVSYGYRACLAQTQALLRAAANMTPYFV